MRTRPLFLKEEKMRYFLWRLLGRCFWIKLNSHYEVPFSRNYSEWEQKKDTIKNHYIYDLRMTLLIEE